MNGQSDFSGSLSSSASLTGNTEVNDVNGSAHVSGLINVHQLICDATVTYDTTNGQRVITIVYDGTNCWGNRTRTGTVTISMPVGQRWKNADQNEFFHNQVVTCLMVWCIRRKHLSEGYSTQ